MSVNTEWSKLKGMLPGVTPSRPIAMQGSQAGARGENPGWLRLKSVLGSTQSKAIDPPFVTSETPDVPLPTSHVGAAVRMVDNLNYASDQKR